jgi:hypothetical protein
MLCVVETTKGRINCGIDHSLDFWDGKEEARGGGFSLTIMTRIQPYGHVHGVGPKVKRCINK